jgi:GTP cyclohydrolase I
MKESESWQVMLKHAVELYISENAHGQIDTGHVYDTPTRVVRAYSDFVSGYLEDPAKVLDVTFTTEHGYDEMVHCLCAHHLLPIIGRAHFAYIPGGRIVGLSKIPRFIDILSRRLQVQENLTEQIVDTFTKAIGPAGCAVSVAAIHCCMISRGIRQHDEVTQTTALRGVFKTSPQTRNEFLASINNNEAPLP